MPNPFSEEETLLSVITPVYKDAWKTFPKFFRALNEQEFKKFEVIIVFDGENKRGELELRKMQAQYPSIDCRFVTQEHAGAPAARNTGAREALGGILTFTDPDVYWYSDSFRMLMNELEAHPEKDVVWGLYDMEMDERAITVGGSVPVDPTNTPDYWAFRFSNYCSGAFPVRKSAFVGWDETVKSLQDWDMWQRMLLSDNFTGSKFHYIPRPFFLTEPVRRDGISSDSHNNWLERVKYVRDKNGIPLSDTVVCSLGAPFHGINVAKNLGADYLPMPSFKPHTYKTIYLLGFYPGPGSTKAHLSVFDNAEGAKKIIHWIGTDVYKMRTEVPFVSLKYLKDLWDKDGYIHLTEAQHTHDEMEELGISSHIVPIPPQKLYQDMPLPEKFSVAIYENATQSMYSEELMEDVSRSMPDVQFYFFGNEQKKGIKTLNTEHLGWIDLDEWLPKFSVNLRVTVHDGLPITPLQFLTAGRFVISNTDFKGALVVDKDRKQIVEAIRRCQQTTPDPKHANYWRTECDFDTYHKRIAAL